MSYTLTRRPDVTEYAPYYSGYISQVPDGDVVALLGAQIDDTLALLRAIPEQRATHRYAPGKWSIKEVIAHLSDTERIMSYRALRIARGDQTPLAGFEQNDYVAIGRFDRLPLRDLSDELGAVRQATLHFVRNLDDEACARRGTANGFEVTARALAYIIAGHERHHMSLLRSRYLPG